jgi:hypothetical protein
MDLVDYPWNASALKLQWVSWHLAWGLDKTRTTKLFKARSMICSHTTRLSKARLPPLFLGPVYCRSHLEESKTKRHSAAAAAWEKLLHANRLDFKGKMRHTTLSAASHNGHDSRGEARHRVYIMYLCMYVYSTHQISDDTQWKQWREEYYRRTLGV